MMIHSSRDQQDATVFTESNLHSSNSDGEHLALYSYMHTIVR
jgi:hypothetical protein